MRAAVVLVMILGGATLTKADIIETISLDLSDLNPGSTLSGSFALPDSPPYGDTAPVTLSFSDPSDYSPTSLTTTISLTTFGGEFFSVYFDTVNLTAATYAGPVEIELVLSGFDSPAVCSGFPCTSQGTFLIVSPESAGPGGLFFHDNAAFTITPVPEPRYALLVSLLFLTIIFGRSLLVRNHRRAPESDRRTKTTCEPFAPRT